MIKNITKVIATASVVLTLAAGSVFAQDKTTPSSSITLKDPVAVVDGEKISSSELQKAVQEAVEGAGMKITDLSQEQLMEGYKQILDEMVITKLLDKAASGVTVSKDEINEEIAKFKSQFPSEEVFTEQLKAAGQTPEAFASNVEKALRQQKWMQTQINGKDEISDAQVKEFYDQNKDKLAQPERVQASHILIRIPEGASDDVIKQKEQAAQAAAERARKGEDFATLAKELSEEPIAKMSGGDLGYFPKEQMVPEFSEAAFSQKVGEIGNPVKTQFGWHVIKVTDKKPAGTPELAEIKEELTGLMKNMQQQQAISEAIDKLRKDSKVEINLPESTPATAPSAQ